MTIFRSRRCLFVPCLVLLVVASSVTNSFAKKAAAVDVLQLVPEQSLGFAVVNNLGDVDAKIQRFATMFDITGIPAPLTFLKFATGLDAGLDREGQVLLSLIAGEDPSSAPAPMLLLPVSDYEMFVEPIQGDATGEICRVQLAGEDILVAKQGNYAVLMNLEHREKLVAQLAREPQATPLLAPLQSWMGSNDILFTLMPSGVDLLTKLGQAGLQKQQQNYDDMAEQNDEFGEHFKNAKRGLQMYEYFLGGMGAEVESVAVGIHIDDEDNLQVGKRVLLSKSGMMAGLAAVDPLKTQPMAQIPEGDVVGAFGGPFAAEWAKEMSSLSAKIMRSMPDLYGLQELSEEDQKKLENTWAESMNDLKSITMAMLPGQEGDPIYSNFYSVMEVKDANEYLDTYEKAIVSWNDLMDKSTSDLKFRYEIERTAIAGKSCLTMSADIAKMVGDDANVAMMKQMMTLMFGEDGIMKIHLVAVDDNRLVAGLANETQMEAMMTAIADGTATYADGENAKITLGKLDPTAQWSGVVSPQGCVSWFGRMLKVIMGQFGQGSPQIPEYPETPPVGFGLKIADGMVAADMVWPSETLQGLAQFIEDTKEANE